MRLLDFVEQHNAVRLAAHLFAELAAVLEAHVARRRANQPGRIEFLAVFVHVYAYQIVFRIEEIFGYGLGQLGLAYACRTEEEEGAYGPVGAAYARAAAAYGFHHCTDGLILAYYPRTQHLFHLHKLAAFPFGYPACRYACHQGYDLRYVRGLDHVAAALAVPLDAYHRAGFVQGVYGLVGKAAVGDVAVREQGAGLYGLGAVAHFVVGFVPVLDTFEYAYGIGHSGRLYHQFLEAPLQGSVLLDYPREFLNRSGSYALYLAPGQGRFEHIRRIQAAGGAAGPHQSVEFVDEQNDVRVCRQFFYDTLESFLEIAPVARPGHD